MRKRLSLLIAVAALGLVIAVPEAAAGGGCHAGPDMKMSTGTDTLAGIGECAFYPTVLYIEPGQEVTWVNKDPVPHTVTGAAYSWGSEREIAPGSRVSYAFKKEGVYPFYCAYHPAMVGAVVVGDATNAAALSSSGFAAVEEVDAGSSGGSDQDAVETTTSQTTSPLMLVLAAIAFLGIVGIAWRTLSPRRRAVSATPAP